MLLAIAGPSTVGKDAIWLHVARELGFFPEVPLTTRPRRHSEIDGREYHFVSLEEFQSMIKNGQLTAWDFVLGNYYGTQLSLTDRVNAGEKVVLQALGRMAIRLKTQLPNVRTVILQVSDRAVLRRRLEERKFSATEIEGRLRLADEELVHSSLFDFVVPDADILTEDEVRRVLLEITTDLEEPILS